MTHEEAVRSLAAALREAETAADTDPHPPVWSESELFTRHERIAAYLIRYVGPHGLAITWDGGMPIG